MLLVFVAGAINWPAPGNPAASKFLKGIEFHLGLDLQGGTHLIYNADTSQIPAADRVTALDGARDVIERRVNAFGVAEPLVQVNQSVNDWRIIVELPGIKDVNQAIRMIGETPLMEFKEEGVQLTEKQVTEQEKQDVQKYNEDAEKRAEDILQKALAPNADFASLAQEYSEDDANKANGGDLDWFKEGIMVKEFEDAVVSLKDGETTPQLVTTTFGYHIIKKTGERDAAERDSSEKIKEYRASHILIKTKVVLPFEQTAEWKNTQLSGKNLKTAQLEFDPSTGEPRVALEFDGEGAKLFGEITERNIGKPVGIFLDGQPISVPKVNEAIKEGKAVITGQFTLEEAKLLVQRLNAGALPVPIALISQQSIGPSLGQIYLQKSLLAALIGFIFVILFMIAYYRLPGLLSAFALVIYALVILSLFKLIPVTLTLAGIAGFVLSLGMAVDANVLIFERMKEELRGGKSLDMAIKDGFIRAWPSIRDGNFSTLITCFVLYWFGTSVIRGFGLTLFVGVLVSMFSAISISKVLLKLVSKWKIVGAKWIWTGKSKIKAD